MKRITLGLVLITILQFGMSVSTAHAEPIGIIVEGIVTDHGAPAPGKAIVARCKNGGHEKFADVQFTDNNGHYKLHVNTGKCPLGSIMHLLNLIRISPDEYDTSVSVITRVHTVANIEIGKITYPIPEYSWIGGAGALVLSMATILYVRGRNQV